MILLASTGVVKGDACLSNVGCVGANGSGITFHSPDTVTSYDPLIRVASPFGRAARRLARRGRGLAHRARAGDQEPALAGRLLADRPRRRRRRPALRALGARRLGALRAAGLELADPAARGRLPHDGALRALAPARRGAVRAAARCVRDHPPEALDGALGDDPLALPAVRRRRGHDAHLERRDPPLDRTPTHRPRRPIRSRPRSSTRSTTTRAGGRRGR